MKATITKAVILMMTFIGLMACNSDKPEEFDENPLNKTTWVVPSAQDGIKVTVSFDSDAQGTMRAITTTQSGDANQEALPLEVIYKFDYALSGTVVYVVCKEAVLTINGKSEQVECDHQSVEFLYDRKTKTLTLDADEENGGQQVLKQEAYSPIGWPEVTSPGVMTPPTSTDFDPAVFNNTSWMSISFMFDIPPIGRIVNVWITNGKPKVNIIASTVGVSSHRSVEADSYTYQNGVLTITDGDITVVIDEIGETEPGKFTGRIHVTQEGKDGEYNWEINGEVTDPASIIC